MDDTYLTAAIWMGLALLASLISIRIGISVALVEIVLGVVGGNTIGLKTTPWIDFLAAFGAVLLTFLAGAEIDPQSMRRHLRASLVIGAISFAAPFAAAFAVAYFVLGWTLPAAEIAGLALSTTSVAVVYAVMIESGLARQELGKLILAACFVTDLGTVLFLGLLFADVSPLLVGFAAATALAILIVPRLTRILVTRVPDRVSSRRSISSSSSCSSSAGWPRSPERGRPAGLPRRPRGGRRVRRRSRHSFTGCGDGVLAADAVLLSQGGLARVRFRRSWRVPG